MEFNLRAGMTAQKQETVTDANTAIRYGSGSAAVYATPAMVGLMEGACLAAVDPHLPAGMSTVGIGLDIRHLAATPVGLNVRAEAELTAIAGKRLTFKVTAFDSKEKIGEGLHERYIIDAASFMEKAAKKK
ncbi:MAG: thioesterase family protein [Sporomusaceae bacterium]|nr:thioesterase family protein [Sporomusaceae bacterium]